MPGAGYAWSLAVIGAVPRLPCRKERAGSLTPMIRPAERAELRRLRCEPTRRMRSWRQPRRRSPLASNPAAQPRTAEMHRRFRIRRRAAENPGATPKNRQTRSVTQSRGRAAPAPEKTFGKQAWLEISRYHRPSEAKGFHEPLRVTKVIS